MLIRVMQRHIENGKRRSAAECPVALAVKEQLKPKGCVFVLDNLYIAGVNYYLPKEVSEVIDTYDKTGKMEPFAFTLRLDWK